MLFRVFTSHTAPEYPEPRTSRAWVIPLPANEPPSTNLRSNTAFDSLAAIEGHGPSVEFRFLNLGHRKIASSEVSPLLGADSL